MKSDHLTITPVCNSSQNPIACIAKTCDRSGSTYPCVPEGDEAAALVDVPIFSERATFLSLGQRCQNRGRHIAIGGGSDSSDQGVISVVLELSSGGLEARNWVKYKEIALSACAQNE
jgi:hypothetical protein